MKILDMPRGFGKTYNLLFQQSISQDNIPIVVATDNLKRVLISLYKDEFPNINILSLDEYMRLPKKPEKIYIDEVFILLSKIFKDSKIEVCSFSSEDL